jgi:RNA polymerase sigma-70 factor (ECF subfamily)
VSQQSEHRQDRELSRRAAHGDEKAWRQLYEQTCQQLFNLLCYQVGDREVAKDLLQETYVTALQKLDGYRGEGSLLGWLRTIALRKSLDWRRRVWRQLRQLSVLAAEAPAPAANPGEARLELASRAFQTALGKLSAKQRAVLLLRELEDLSFREIAEVVGCSEATTRVHHHRALANMKRMLAAGEDRALADKLGGQRA